MRHARDKRCPCLEFHVQMRPQCHTDPGGARGEFCLPSGCGSSRRRWGWGCLFHAGAFSVKEGRAPPGLARSLVVATVLGSSLEAQMAQQSQLGSKDRLWGRGRACLCPSLQESRPRLCPAVGLDPNPALGCSTAGSDLRSPVGPAGASHGGQRPVGCCSCLQHG